MYQLNYHSKSVPGLELEDLENILETAITANSACNISGCLVYHKGSFVQILEGNKKDVLDTFDKIKNDARHSLITLLWENQVDSRCFSEWHMAYHRPEDENLKLYINNLLLLSELSEKSSGALLNFWATVKKMLRDDTINQHEYMT